MKTVAFFNNKGGVGKTTLVHHVAWMLAELEHNVLAIDLDSQSNLSSMFLDDQKLEIYIKVGFEQNKEGQRNQFHKTNLILNIAISINW